MTLIIALVMLHENIHIISKWIQSICYRNGNDIPPIKRKKKEKKEVYDRNVCTVCPRNFIHGQCSALEGNAARPLRVGTR